MEDALRLSVAEVKSIRKDYAELYEQFKQLASHASTLQQQHDSVVKKNESMKRRIKEFEFTRKTFEDDVLHLEMASRLLEKREKDVEETLSSLRENLLTSRGMCELQEKEIVDLKHVMATGYIHVDAHRRLMEKNDEDYKVISKRNESLMTDLEHNYVRKEEFLAALSQIDSISSEKSRCEDFLQQSQRKELEACGALQATSAQLSALQVELAAAHAKLAEAERFYERHSDCEAVHRADVEKLMACESSKASLLTQLGSEKLVSRRERDALKPCQEQVRELTARVTEAAEERARLLVELQHSKEIQASLQSCQEKCNVLFGQKIEAESLCEELYGKRTELETELVRVKEENLGLHRKLLDMAPELETLRSQLDEFRNAVMIESSNHFEAFPMSPPAPPLAAARSSNALDFLGAAYHGLVSPGHSPVGAPGSQRGATTNNNHNNNNHNHSSLLLPASSRTATPYSPRFADNTDAPRSDTGVFTRSVEAEDTRVLHPHELQAQQRLRRQLDKQEEEFQLERETLVAAAGGGGGSSSGSGRRGDFADVRPPAPRDSDSFPVAYSVYYSTEDGDTTSPAQLIRGSVRSSPPTRLSQHGRSSALRAQEERAAQPPAIAQVPGFRGDDERDSSSHEGSASPSDCSPLEQSDEEDAFARQDHSRSRFPQEQPQARSGQRQLASSSNNSGSNTGSGGGGGSGRKGVRDVFLQEASNYQRPAHQRGSIIHANSISNNNNSSSSSNTSRSGQRRKGPREEGLDRSATDQDRAFLGHSNAAPSNFSAAPSSNILLLNSNRVRLRR